MISPTANPSAMSVIEQCGWLGLAVVGLVGAAMFSGMETGCYTLNRVRLSVRASSGDSRAQQLQRSLDRPESLLATLLAGNNISNYFGALGATAFLGGFGYADSQIVMINTVVLTPLILIFGESLPKEVFRRAADTLTYRFAPMLSFFGAILQATGIAPAVVWQGRAIGKLVGIGPGPALAESRARVAELLKEGSASGAISYTQLSLIDRATEFTRVSVADEMIPWTRVRTVFSEAPPAQAVATINATRHAALPVVDRSGRAVAVVRAMDVLLDPTRPLTEHWLPPVVVRESMRVVEAMRLLQSAGQTLAIVERGGRPVGIVTVKDLLEPLVGVVLEST